MTATDPDRLVQWHIDKANVIEFFGNRIDWDATLALTSPFDLAFGARRGTYCQIIPLIVNGGRKIALHIPRSARISCATNWIGTIDRFRNSSADRSTRLCIKLVKSSEYRHLFRQSAFQRAITSEIAKIGDKLDVGDCFLSHIVSTTSRPMIESAPEQVRYFVEQAKATGRISEKLFESICKADLIAPIFFCDEWVDFVSCERFFMAPKNREQSAQWRWSQMDKLLRAFAFLHSTCNIVHHDVSSGNVGFVRRENGWSLLVVDFGFARFVPPPQALTGTPAKCKERTGTPYFLSPQALRFIPHDDVKAEAFSVGVVANYILTGKLCWPNLRTPSQLRKVHEQMRCNEYVVEWPCFDELSAQQNEFVVTKVAQLLFYDEEERPTVAEILK